MKVFKVMSVLVLLVLATTGCKSVQTSFVNTTNEPVKLEVNGPGLNVENLGTIPAGGEVRTAIKVSTIWLPTTYTWTAGEHRGEFTIASDSKDIITIGVPEGANVTPAAWRMAEGKEQTGVNSPVTFSR